MKRGILAVVALASLALSCGSPSPPSTPTPPPVAWSPDGVIAPDDYSATKDFPDYELHWRSDGQYAYMAMKARTSGWVAIGIGPDSRMRNADVILGYVKEGKTVIYDMFSTGFYGPHPPDAQMGGTDDILEFGGREEGEYTIIEFKRALATGDRYDKELVRGTIDIIWAYGPSDEFSSHHVSRGEGQIDF